MEGRTKQNKIGSFQIEHEPTNPWTLYVTTFAYVMPPMIASTTRVLVTTEAWLAKSKPPLLHCAAHKMCILSPKKPCTMQYTKTRGKYYGQTSLYNKQSPCNYPLFFLASTKLYYFTSHQRPYGSSWSWSFPSWHAALQLPAVEDHRELVLSSTRVAAFELLLQRGKF